MTQTRIPSQIVRPGHRYAGQVWNEHAERYDRVPEAGNFCWSHCERVATMPDGRPLYRCEHGHAFTATDPGEVPVGSAPWVRV